MTAPAPDPTPNYVEIPRPCWHCLTGDSEHTEAWHWLVSVGDGGPVIALARDNEIRLRISIREEALEMLMGKPITLTDVLKDGI